MKHKHQTVPAAAMPRVTATEIVCGDCCGSALLPKRTLLTSNGDCANCGGRSFELASKLCEKLASHLTRRQELPPASRSTDVMIVDQANGLY